MNANYVPPMCGIICLAVMAEYEWRLWNKNGLFVLSSLIIQFNGQWLTLLKFEHDLSIGGSVQILSAGDILHECWKLYMNRLILLSC